jgi:DNA-binding MarR family transcriptional regulator
MWIAFYWWYQYSFGYTKMIGLLMASMGPLPTVIGPTENALRALLTKTLSSSRATTYPAWVILNAASSVGATSPQRSWHHSAADALKTDLDGVAQVIEGLRSAGLLNSDEALTDAGVTELAAARLAVGATTLRLTEGISDAEQETVRSVLDRIRSNAEALLERTADTPS